MRQGLLRLKEGGGVIVRLKGRSAVVLAILAACALTALVLQTRRIDSHAALLNINGQHDPFVNDFLSKSKNTGLSERKYVHSWVKQVKHGGLFHKLHAFEREKKQERKAWRDKQLQGITEPDGNSLFNDLMKTRNRAIGAESSRSGADNLQHRTDQELGARDTHGKKKDIDFGAYRRHADSIAPKYAGKRTLPIMHREIPKMDSKVNSLLHDLGEAHPDRRAHTRAHTKLKPAATSQLASRPSSSMPGEEIAVQQEIAAAKHAARNPSYRQAFAPSPQTNRFRGGRIGLSYTNTHTQTQDTHTHTHTHTHMYIHKYKQIYIHRHIHSNLSISLSR